MSGRMEYPSGLKHFEVVAGDANGQTWKMWKRSFDLYLLANKIETTKKINRSIKL